MTTIIQQTNQWVLTQIQLNQPLHPAPIRNLNEKHFWVNLTFKVTQSLVTINLAKLSLNLTKTKAEVSLISI